MDLKEKLGIHLDQIKRLKGIENVVLTQRDGNPIQSAGVWFSKNEIFNVCSTTSTIFNAGIHLHPDDLKYILIEGKKAKILIAPLNSPICSPLKKILKQHRIVNKENEFFIAITARPNTNLGGIFLHTSECLKKIKTSLITSGESFKPPLIEFSEEEIRKITSNFDLKNNITFDLRLTPFSLSLSKKVSNELHQVLKNFSIIVPHLRNAYVTIEGGAIIANITESRNLRGEDIDKISAMSYSLFHMANRCAWVLKKMNAESILLDCGNTYQFICKTGKVIFGTEIEKSPKILNLVRLAIPQFSKDIDELIVEASESQKIKKFNVKKLLKDLAIS